MIAFGYYLIKLLLCSSVLFLYYCLLLRNKAFHHWNRFYLLLAVALSIALPLIQIPVEASQEQNNPAFTIIQAADSVDDFIAAAPIPSNRISLAQVMLYCYLAVSVCLFGMLLNSLRRIRGLLKANHPVPRGRLVFVVTDAPAAPFSFFNFIFWNNNIDLHTHTGELIYKHELAHIQGKHTIDKLFMEFVLCLFWCNPLFWFMRRELSMVHEYIADQKSMGNQGTEAFAAIVLQTAFPEQRTHLSNPFFKSSIKRRLVMFNTSKSPKFSFVSRILVLPLLALMVMSFTLRLKKLHLSEVTSLAKTDTTQKPRIFSGSVFISTKDSIVLQADTVVFNTEPSRMKISLKRSLFIVDGVKVEPSILLTKTIVSKELHFYSEDDPEGVRLYGSEATRGVIVFKGVTFYDVPNKEYYKAFYEQPIETGISGNMVFTEAEVMPAFPGGENAWQKYVQQHLNTSIPTTNKAPKGSYTVVVDFTVDQSGNIIAVEPLTKNGYGMEEEAVRLIKEGPKWSPALQNRKQVICKTHKSVTFKIG